ncbi:unnamed protein product [Eruca vesicaria subsp. sativa]|uniref:BHLH domain-containing protein n=1 Tax=Eruca vesicaria subsp. sativa TaxID=29727 RepID=A0ABC8JL72_ERUVS|nr:unnamed protein product [Eruca vesicaria subsp. sativa]
MNPFFADCIVSGFFSNSRSINGGDIDNFLARTETVETLSSSVTSESGNFKKRKFDSFFTETKICNEKKTMMINIGVLVQEEEEEKSIVKEQNKESNKSIMNMKNKAKEEENNCSNDSSKVAKELQRKDYIHVRAWRGQATDSHSIAVRARREKISERMKYLQALVLGCDKITRKAGALDEIINYVLSLQRQVEV